MLGMPIPRTMHRIILLRRLKLKIFIVTFIVVLVYCLIFYKSMNVSPLWKLYNKNKKAVVELQYVVVHIDLKGAPPKLEYLRSLLPALKDNGANGLLMEYEDMFPYEGKLVNLSAKNCYDRAHLQNFTETAVQLGFEIIPLIQTFGHLEYALKLEEFRGLREDLVHPDSMCPSKVKSKNMVMEMLEQVVTFHARISPLKHIHVGCDEVYVINKCMYCKRRKLSNENLFIDYVRYISNVISNLSPDTIVLIWDDMLRKVKPQSWVKIANFNNIEPVYWHYAELDKFPHVDMMNYRKKFKNQWLATAYKGADGKTATIPNLYNRLVNHFSWMANIQTAKVPGENKVYHFKGIILTGWSRYSHLDPICELLPVSIPSLITNLRTIKQFKIGFVDKSIDIDKFYKFHLATGDSNFYCLQITEIIPSIDYICEFCYFKGHNLFYLTNFHIVLINDIKSFLISYDEISAFEYYFKSNYINKNEIQLNEVIEKCSESSSALQDTEYKISVAMKEYFEDDVIDEYIGYTSYSVKKKLAYLCKSLQTFSLYNGSWERRPNQVTNFSIY